jgi:hypothetical protein
MLPPELKYIWVLEFLWYEVKITMDHLYGPALTIKIVRSYYGKNQLTGESHLLRHINSQQLHSVLNNGGNKTRQLKAE